MITERMTVRSVTDGTISYPHTDRSCISRDHSSRHRTLAAVRDCNHRHEGTRDADDEVVARRAERHAPGLGTRRGRVRLHARRYVRRVPLHNVIDLSHLSPILSDALLPMRSIPSQFRASAKKTPTEPSYFVSLIFKHTKAFFGIQTVDGPASALKDSLLVPVVEGVFEVVAQ